MEQRFSNSSRLSINEKKFIETALHSGLRVDGRRSFDYRDITIEFGRENGSSEVHLGQTYVVGLVTSQLVQPYRDRPNEGILSIFSEFSPMADPSFEAGRPGESAVELGLIIDRALRESRSVDSESLCVVPGKFVWAIRVDLHILDNAGNLVDAANIAALAALLTFRRPECTISGNDDQDVIILPPEVKDPIPLILHHLPIAITFAFFGEENVAVIDPTHFEEAVMVGKMTATVNVSGDVCALQKAGGEGMTTSVIMQCLRIASAKAADITTKINNAVEVYNIEREHRKVKCDPSGLVDICESSHVNNLLFADVAEMDSKTKQFSFGYNDDMDIAKDAYIQNRISKGYSEAKNSVKGPLSWDPYSKGIDFDELKVSLASIASSNKRLEKSRNDFEPSYDKRTLVQHLLPVKEGINATAIHTISSKKGPAEDKLITNQALTLEDAVKPEHQRRRKKTAR